MITQRNFPNYTSSRWADSDGIQTTVRVRNWRNYDLTVDSAIEDNWPDGLPEHVTVPGMTLSMQEILNRHKRGVQLPSNHSFFDESLPEFGRMNKFDVADLARENAQFIEDFQKGEFEKKKKKDAQTAAQIAADRAELERLRALSGNQQTDSNQG